MGAPIKTGNIPDPQGNQNVNLETQNAPPVTEKPFFQIPPEMQGKITPEQMALMNQVGKQWQANNTKKRQEETRELRETQQQLEDTRRRATLLEEKSNQLDTLQTDPDFKNLVASKLSGVPYNQPAQFQDTGINFDEYEDGQSLKAFGEHIQRQTAKEVIGEVQKMLAPVLKNVATSSFDSQMASLAATADKNKWPSPERYTDEIQYNMRHYGLDAMKAYKLAAAEQLNTPQQEETPITQPGESGGTPTEIPPVTPQGNEPVLIQPGASGPTSVPLNSNKSPLEEAQEMRAKGEYGQGLGSALNSVLKDVGERLGLTVKPEDLD